MMALPRCTLVNVARHPVRRALIILSFASVAHALVFTVPAGCYTLTVTLKGAGGGAGVQTNAHGGSGQIVVADLPVTPGSSLNYMLGTGGPAGTAYTFASTGGSGGGASAVWTTSSSTPKLVAAAGGGGATFGGGSLNNSGCPGGDAGYPNGFSSACFGGCGGGGPGTQSSGGSAGAHSPPSGNINGAVGIFQNGGNGATDTVNHASDCTFGASLGWGVGGHGGCDNKVRGGAGGGGAGYYGGGGGGTSSSSYYGSPGGGGSSYSSVAGATFIRANNGGVAPGGVGGAGAANFVCVTPTVTVSASRLPTVTMTQSGSRTRSITPSYTISITRTGTTSVSTTPTTSVSRSGTNTVSRSNTLSISVSRSASPTWTGTVTGSGTISVSRTKTPSGTPPFSQSSTGLVVLSIAVTRTPSVSTTGTTSATLSRSGTGTVTLTRTYTPLPTTFLTTSPTVSRSATMAVTGTQTPSAPLTRSPTTSVSRSRSLSASQSVTVTQSNTRSRDSTFTGTPSQTGSIPWTPSQTGSIPVTPSISSTLTGTPSQPGSIPVTPSMTPTFTSSGSHTGTHTDTPSRTGSIPATGSDTFTFSSTATISTSATATATASSSGDSSISPSASVSTSGSTSETASVTCTITPSRTATPSPTSSRLPGTLSLTMQAPASVTSTHVAAGLDATVVAAQRAPRVLTAAFGNLPSASSAQLSCHAGAPLHLTSSIINISSLQTSVSVPIWTTGGGEVLGEGLRVNTSTSLQNAHVACSLMGESSLLARAGLSVNFAPASWPAFDDLIVIHESGAMMTGSNEKHTMTAQLMSTCSQLGCSLCDNVTAVLDTCLPAVLDVSLAVRSNASWPSAPISRSLSSAVVVVLVNKACTLATQLSPPFATDTIVSIGGEVQRVQVSGDGCAIAFHTPDSGFCGSADGECGYQSLEVTNTGILPASMSCPPFCPGAYPGAVPFVFSDAEAAQPAFPRADALPLPVSSAVTSMGLYFTTGCSDPAYTDPSTGACTDASNPVSEMCAYGSGSTCRVCPTGALCPGGYRIWALPGYYVASELDREVTQCAPPAFSRCLGWNVTTSRTECGQEFLPGSFGCLTCARGFYSTLEGGCNACPKVDSFWDLLRPVVTAIGSMVAGILLLFFAVYGIAKVAGYDVKGGLGSTVNLVVWSITTMQLVAQSSRSMPPGLPPAFTFWQTTLLYFQFEGVAVPSACTPDDPFATDVAQMQVVLFLLLSQAIMFATMYTLRKMNNNNRYIETGGVRPLEARKCTTVSTVLLEVVSKVWALVSLVQLALHSLVTNAALGLLVCQPKLLPASLYVALTQDGTSLLDAGLHSPPLVRELTAQLKVQLLASNPSHVCYEGKHKEAASLAWTTLAIFSVGYPFVSMLVTRYAVLQSVRGARGDAQAWHAACDADAALQERYLWPNRAKSHSRIDAPNDGMGAKMQAAARYLWLGLAGAHVLIASSFKHRSKLHARPSTPTLRLDSSASSSMRSLLPALPVPSSPLLSSPPNQTPIKRATMVILPASPLADEPRTTGPLLKGWTRDALVDDNSQLRGDPFLAPFLGSNYRQSAAATFLLVERVLLVALAAVMAVLVNPVTVDQSSTRAAGMNIVVIYGVWTYATRQPYKPSEKWKLYVKIGSLCITGLAAITNAVGFAGSVQPVSFAADATDPLAWLTMTASIMLIMALLVGFFASVVDLNQSQRHRLPSPSDARVKRVSSPLTPHLHRMSIIAVPPSSDGYVKRVSSPLTPHLHRMSIMAVPTQASFPSLMVNPLTHNPLLVRSPPIVATEAKEIEPSVLQSPVRFLSDDAVPVKRVSHARPSMLPTGPLASGVRSVPRASMAVKAQPTSPAVSSGLKNLDVFRAPREAASSHHHHHGKHRTSVTGRMAFGTLKTTSQRRRE